jgi:uncharacterized lipoprotein YddW (UPF0748 family)
MSEVHALWVVRHSIATPAASDRLVELAVRYGYKDLIIQVRARGDAMYQSVLEPPAELLREPSLDPLSHVLASAHKAGLRVHAWLNMLLTWSGSKRPISPDHMVNSHSDWLMVHNSGRTILASDYEGLYVCPSRPEVQAHLWRVVMDVAQRYPVDGIHLDYIRYPGPEFCYCPACQKAFTLSLIRQGNGDANQADAMVDGANARWGRAWPDEAQYAAAWADFRRQQVTDLVASVYRGVKRLKPQATVSAAVFPNWLDAQKARFQDWHGWAKAGLLDLICPMTYSKDTAVVEAQIREAVTESHGRRIWAGLGAWQLPPEGVLEKVRAVRALGVDGYALFSYGGITQEVADETYLKALQARLAALPEPPGSCPCQ